LIFPSLVIPIYPIEGQTLQWPKDKRNMKTKTMVDKILQIE
jgi:hypothetical protein